MLQNAILSREIGPSVTDAALHAKYDAEIASKPGDDEVHARHILVDNEDQAKKIIDRAEQRCADFAALAKANSKDPAAQNGGDLGFFKKADMVPEFATAAFALKPGRVDADAGEDAVRLARDQGGRAPGRAAAVPFDQAKDELRQQIIQAGVRQALWTGHGSGSRSRSSTWTARR